jgi:hypothetical protein
MAGGSFQAARARRMGPGLQSEGLLSLWLQRGTTKTTHILTIFLIAFKINVLRVFREGFQPPSSGSAQLLHLSFVRKRLSPFILF